LRGDDRRRTPRHREPPEAAQALRGQRLRGRDPAPGAQDAPRGDRRARALEGRAGGVWRPRGRPLPAHRAPGAAGVRPGRDRLGARAQLRKDLATVSDREWILLNPGPANTSREVREALVTPDLCHREPEFFEVMRDCRERLVRLAEGGRGFAAVLFTGSGTAAVEAAVSSAVPAYGGLLVVDNGVYGDRLLRIARAHGIPSRALSYDVATPARPDDVRAALRAERHLTHVVVVHHETTTGVLNPVAEIVRAAAGEGRRVLVDAMSSLFGEPLDVTQDGIDFVMASANKCLQGVPGISFVLARRQALDAPRGRPPRSVYLDLASHYVAQERDNTPFTPAVQVLHAVRQGLRALSKGGASERIARYAENARVLR